MVGPVAGSGGAGGPRGEFDCDVIAPLIGPLLATARRVLRDESLAWDAVQESLIQLWKEPEMPANPRGWLVRAVVYRSLFLARTRARRRSHERKASERRSELSTRDDPSNQLAYRERAAELDRILGELPPGYRDVVTMRTDDEMDYAEIAAALKIPIGTVRSRLNRTRKWIQDAIAEDECDRAPRGRSAMVAC